jgi:quinone-modifying oxidoreductase subunit QmoB
VPQLEKIAKKEGKMAVVKGHPFLCNAEGVQMIRDDIANEAVTHVCIAACSRRAKAEAFQLPRSRRVARQPARGRTVGRRRRPDHDEVRQEMAEDYVRMGCAEVKKMKVPGGNVKEASSKKILVVGGGMSGMTAALAAAEAGYEALLVEKSGALGGFANNLWKRVPFKPPLRRRHSRSGAAELAAKVSGQCRRSRCT